MNLFAENVAKNGWDSLEKFKNLFPESFLKIEVVGKGACFLPYREALVEAINKFGFKAKGFDYIDYEYNPDGFLIINPLQYMNEKFQYNQYVYAAIQTEQITNNEVYCIDMGTTRYKKLKKCISKYDLIFEWSPASYRFLNNKYNHVYFFPHCNFESLQYFNKYKNVEEKYDLFFTGWAEGIHNRRGKILKVLSERYKMYPKYEDLWGEEKEKAIMSSKICLNLHFDNCLVYESPRLYEYIANKRFVLTERIWDSYPFVDGEDYQSFYIHNMIQKIDYYLANPQERLRVASNGFNKINNYSLDDYIGTILERFILEKWIRKSKRYSFKNLFFHKLRIPRKN